MSNNILTVYSASAGSGKTFTLAVKYIELLIEQPENYRKILAVTFTNKATDEMKLRILSQLYGLANALEDSKDYANKIKQDFHDMGKTISDEIIMRNAGKALNYLLHNYNYFRIQTIDAFFQQVTRNMARELNLNANFKLSLNDSQVEENAVDEMIEKLTPKSNVMKWILDYINENISEDKNWNVISSIKKFGQTIFSDIYKAHEKELNEVFQQPDFFKNFDSIMRSIMKDAEDEYRKIYDDYQALMEANGVSFTDFKSGKSGACGYFEKFGNGIKAMAGVEDDKHFNKTAQKATEDIGAWVKKGDLGTSLESVAVKLMQMLNETEEKRKDMLSRYKSASNTIRHISKLRLLGSIKEKVDEVNALANRFPLSATQALLNTMIGTNDAPFVYEKIGTQISHIMIDEFQDTSLAQWHNFKVLLEDCMAQNSACLIVGDVKQSIYRWRSSDWRLLNNIGNEFPGYNVTPEQLNTNFRSEANIVKFNNVFFETAAKEEFEDLNSNAGNVDKIYEAKAVRQEISPKKKDKEHKGYVNITLLPPDDYDEVTMQMVANQISELLSKGVKESDIAILTRKNKHIASIGEYLMEELPEVTLVSDEAFVLEASLAVRTIITAMRVMANDSDELSKATLARYSQLLIGNANSATAILKASGDYDSLLPAKFRKEPRARLIQKPIYELAETICNIFKLDKLKNETAYLCKFFDTLASFLADTPATIGDVINEWDENMHKKPIESDKVEGIRLLTIHKSKGLEFDNVIIPYCDWKMEIGDTIWVSPTQSPYSKLPLVPVEFNKTQLAGTIYEADYNEEHMQNMVDNMNLLYVAFTRAGANLFVYGKNPNISGSRATGTRSTILSSTIYELSKAPELEGSNIIEADDTIVFSFGKLYLKENNTDNTEDDSAEKKKINVFKPKVEPVSLSQEDNVCQQANVVFRQSDKSREFVSADDEGTNEEQEAYIKTGTILHRIFSTIETSADIDKALTLLEQEGEIYSSTTTKEKLMEMLHKRLESKKVKEWFSPGWQIFNECAILDINPTTGKVVNRRPDRVMTNGTETIVVDFKFAAPNIEHQRQVAQYMHLLNNMGYANVKGYLWYVYTNKIEEVNA